MTFSLEEKGAVFCTYLGGICMVKQSLDGKWQLTCLATAEKVSAQVPGTVYGALLEGGKIEDPFWRDNENALMERMKEDFEYQLDFVASPEVMDAPMKELVFEGLDTLADVYLNEKKLASTDNMHRTWRFDVTKYLLDGENHLRIYFHGPIPFIKKEYKKTRADGSEEAMVGFPLLRKAHYMFGWDWGPHLPDVGIFRSVTLEGISKARLEGVAVEQFHKKDQVVLKLKIEERCLTKRKATYQAIVKNPNGKVVFEGDATKKIVIEKPKLWWPNGFGEQPLYDITVIQYVGNEETDCYETKIGLRTMEIHREKDEFGEMFAHRVNGVDCFAMGADYIPEDNLLGRLTRERTRELLQQCKDCNFNSIRVWGGGIYPPDWFYELCDEMGLLVWQDFMFACAVYDLNEHFEENIKAEIRDNLRRIRNHACLALMCGNNEMEMFVKDGVWVTSDKQRADYIKMYEYIFPKLMAEYAPGVEYWPASPSSGGCFDDPNSFDRGDVHYWAVWHSSVPFTEFRKYHFRYLSEFGFQSLPAFKTIQSFTDHEEDYNLFSYVMEKHQRNRAANAKIMQYMQQTFRYPNDFKSLIYASQLLQGEAIKYGVEHFRRNRGRCMGAVYWQLNDCWPVISWASIDYCGRWKALQYFAKRFFAPVLLSCEETGMRSEDININGENETFIPSVGLNISNETLKSHKLTVEWELRDNYGKVLKSGDWKTKVGALEAIWMKKRLEFPEIDIFTTYFCYRLIEDGKVISEESVIFSLPKYFHYVDPSLRVWAEGDEVVVEAKAYAKSIEILNENEDLILEDNYFDMNPGTKRLKVLRGKTDSLRVRSVYHIGR